jgi:hypothetical protein
MNCHSREKLMGVGWHKSHKDFIKMTRTPSPGTADKYCPGVRKSPHCPNQPTASPCGEYTRSGLIVCARLMNLAGLWLSGH